jgi:multimeric flavodoxin WrbA
MQVFNSIAAEKNNLSESNAPQKRGCRHMTKILIVYHSQTGHTRRMAEAVAEGAKAMENTEVILKKANEATLDDLLSCNGLAIGTPENFGYMSGMIKDFFDRIYNDAQDKVFRKPYVLFVSAGNDGTGALRAIERIALGYKFKNVFPPVIAKGRITEEILERCREMGGTLAGGCALGIY